MKKTRNKNDLWEERDDAYDKMKTADQNKFFGVHF